MQNSLYNRQQQLLRRIPQHESSQGSHQRLVFPAHRLLPDITCELLSALPSLPTISLSLPHRGERRCLLRRTFLLPSFSAGIVSCFRHHFPVLRYYLFFLPPKCWSSSDQPPGCDQHLHKTAGSGQPCGCSMCRNMWSLPLDFVVTVHNKTKDISN